MTTATGTVVPRSVSASGVIKEYQRIWTPHVGEKATTVRESGNERDRFAVAVLEDETLCTVSGESLAFFLVVQDLSGSRSLRWWFSARFPRYRKRSVLWEFVEVV